MKLPTSQEMQNLDRSAIETFGIPSIVLMENAGLGTVRMIERELGPCKDSFALIFVGPGNNGGDGLVIGRHLHQRGCHPIFFFLVNPDNLKGDAAVNLNIVKNLRLPFHVVDNEVRAENIPILYKQFESRGYFCYAIIDSIFGIGLTREVSGHYADVIELINRTSSNQKIPVVSVDTPSGMDSDTGKVLGSCVHADYTATYCCAKPGHFTHGSTSWTGKLEIVDIGIPPEAIHRASISTELATKQTIATIGKNLTRDQEAHKGNNGHLLLFAGAIGKTGASILAAKGALRSGAGLVSLCVPYNLNSIYETTLAEAMTIALPNSLDFLTVNDWDLVEASLANKQAIVIGPGLGMAPETVELVEKVYHEAPCTIIFDADALNILAQIRHRLKIPGGPRIFTPHPGELSRLIDKDTSDIQDNRLDGALLGCDIFKNDSHDTIMVLKGAGTIICNDSGKIFINTTGNPGMATGGMGDVLSGIIGGLVCQGLEPMDAAVAGVYLHGSAADVLYKKDGLGFYATEVADTIPTVLKRFL